MPLPRLRPAEGGAVTAPTKADRLAAAKAELAEAHRALVEAYRAYRAWDVVYRAWDEAARKVAAIEGEP